MTTPTNPKAKKSGVPTGIAAVRLNLSVEPALAHKAKALAAKRGWTLNLLVGTALEHYCSIGDPEPPEVEAQLNWPEIWTPDAIDKLGQQIAVSSRLRFTIHRDTMLVFLHFAKMLSTPRPEPRQD